MIPYDIDPSLHAAEPEPPQLDDGFSPPHSEPPEAGVAPPPRPAASADTIGDKSLF